MPKRILTNEFQFPSIHPLESGQDESNLHVNFETEGLRIMMTKVVSRGVILLVCCLTAALVFAQTGDKKKTETNTRKKGPKFVEYTELAPPDWFFREVKVGTQFLSDREYAFTSLPKEMIGGLLVVHDTGYSGWLKGGAVRANKDCISYAVIRWKEHGKVEINDNVFDELEREGWEEVEAQIKTSIDGPFGWKQRIFKIGVEAGDVFLPTGRNDFANRSVFFIFTPDRRVTDEGDSSTKERRLVTYLDDVNEAEFKVHVGSLGKHGETSLKAPDVQRCRLGGKVLRHALAMHPPKNGAAFAVYNLGGKYNSFHATAALNTPDANDGLANAKAAGYNGNAKSPVTFRVIGDGELLWESKPLQKLGDSQKCEVSVAVVEQLKLEVVAAGPENFAWAFWGEPRVDQIKSDNDLLTTPPKDDADKEHSAVNKTTKSIDTTDPARLRDLKEEKNLRDQARRLAEEQHFDAAVEALNRAMTFKRKYQDEETSDSEADIRWLKELQTAKLEFERGLTPTEIQLVRQREYRDTSFDYLQEFHKGGVLAVAISEAEKEFEEIKKARGEKHPDAIAAEERLIRLQTERNELMANLRQTIELRDQAYANGAAEEAAKLTLSAVEQKEKIFGADDPTSVATLLEGARIEQRAGKWDAAQRLFEKGAEIKSKVFGADQWQTIEAVVFAKEAGVIQQIAPEARQRILDIRSRALQAAILLERGRFYKALAVAQEDEAIVLSTDRTFGDFASNQWCYAGILRALGKFHEAEQRQSRALDIVFKTYGENNPLFIKLLNTQSEQYLALGDHVQALAAARRSTALAEKVCGVESGEYATCLNQLGEAELAAGRIDEARELFVKALKISEKDFRTYNQIWTTSLRNLAEVRRIWGEYGESLRLMQHVLKNRTAAYCNAHPETIDALYHLADVEISSGNYEAAAANLETIFQNAKLVYGPNHPKRTEFLDASARMHRARGDFAKAESNLRASLEIARVNLDSTFAVLSERRQLAMTQSALRTLAAYLDLAVHRKQQGEDAYQFVLTWKGAILARQQQMRLSTAAPEIAPLLKEFQEKSRQLATLALAMVTPEQQDAVAEQVAALSQAKERLEGELSKKSEQFRRDQEPLTIARLLQSIPENAALVDFLEYTIYDDPQQTAGARRSADRLAQRKMVAFVVRPQKSIQQIDLGDADSIREMGDLWRTEILRGRGGVDRGLKLVTSKNSEKTPMAQPQMDLRRRIWAPLEPHLEGVELILISPDGATAKLPFGALPGRTAGKYLIEEVPVAIVASPSQLAKHFQIRVDAQPEDNMSLLLAGDVDFGAQAGSHRIEVASVDTPVQRSAPRFGNVTFNRLPGTGREVESIASLFRKQFTNGALDELIGADATEEALREKGPGRRFLHLATHGFFAPESLPALGKSPEKPSGNSSAKSADGSAAPSPRKAETRQGAVITELHPGLLSGIALAGANHSIDGTATKDQIGTVGDDGVMTALEVASLDLQGVELAVLSACETGLGQSAGGEGLLGLQRSFQAAGVKTTIASLWKVDDAATQVLMVEFYRNLWEKKLGKLEALRQAQLTMLRHYDPRQKQLVQRGLKPVNPVQSGDEGPLPPYLWAAFLLSGDWQ